MFAELSALSASFNASFNGSFNAIGNGIANGSAHGDAHGWSFNGIANGGAHGGAHGWSELPLGRLSRGGHRAVSACLGCILVLGSLNNLLVLVLFCRFRSLRTPVNVMLLNISVSDLLVCVCGTTLSFASSLRMRWLFGRSGCMWYGFINSCFGIVSLVSLTLLSYERYSTLLVCNRRAAGFRRPLLWAGGAWLYAALWTAPPLLGWSSYGLEGAGTSCSVTWARRTPRALSYVLCLFLFCLALPLMLMVYCYSRLLLAVRQQVGRVRRPPRRRELQLLLMVLAAVACYLLCWLPYGAVALMAAFGPPGILGPAAATAPSLLAKSSTVINPVIYILLNKQFLRCFLVLLRCRPPQAELGPSSMPSRSTAVPMTRRPGPAPPGSGPAPPASGPAPQASGPAPPASGPAPQASGPAPPSSGPPNPDGTSAGDPPQHDLSSC